MLSLSLESNKLISTGQCPGCNKQSFRIWKNWKLIDDAGRSISPVNVMLLSAPPSAQAVCLQCGHRFYIFTQPEVPVTLEFLGIVETHRSDEYIGREERLIDNLRGAAEVTRKFVVSREWKRECRLGRENSSGTRHGASVDVAKSAKISSEAQQMLRNHYSVIEGQRQVYTEEIEVRVPKGNAVRVLIDWKYIWQHGEVRFRDSRGVITACPYGAVVGLTFDQRQV
jgi:hypothetical protein